MVSVNCYFITLISLLDVVGVFYTLFLLESFQFSLHFNTFILDIFLQVAILVTLIDTLMGVFDVLFLLGFSQFSLSPPRS